MFPAPASLPYNKHLRVASANKHGLWVDPSSLPGPRVIAPPEGGYCTAYILSPNDLAAGLGQKNEALKFNADCYIILARTSHISIAPVYAFVGSNKKTACTDAAHDLARTGEALAEKIHRTSHDKIVSPLFIWADFLSDRGLSKDVDGVFNQGIPALNYNWVSPSENLISGLREALLS